MRPHRTAGAVLLTAACTLAAATAPSAGGWCVLTIRDVPDYLVAGEPFPLVYAVRAHGKTLMSGLSGSVDAGRDGRRIRFAVTPAAQTGHYSATVVLPEPGDWTIRITVDYGQGQTTRLPVTVVARHVPAPRLSPLDRGRQLFAAKGCETCHRDGTSANALAPAVAGRRYTREFLDWRLTTSTTAASPHGGWTWGMPDLQLTRAEVDALVAFLQPDGTATN